MDAILAASSLNGGTSSEESPFKLLADTTYSQTKTMDYGAAGCAWTFSRYGKSSDCNIYEFINPALKLVSTSTTLTITSANTQIYASVSDFRSNSASTCLLLKINSFIGAKYMAFKPFYVVTRALYPGNDSLKIHLEINLPSEKYATATFQFSSKMRVWGVSHLIELL